MANYSKEAIKAMKKLYRSTKDTVMQRRYLSIKLHMEGYTNKHIAAIVMIDEHTVADYISAYDAGASKASFPKNQRGDQDYCPKNSSRNFMRR
jgi:transposase